MSGGPGTGWRPTSTSSTTDPAGEPGGLLHVGRILRAHGLQGAVVIELSSNRTERTETAARLVAEVSLTVGGGTGSGPAPRPDASVAAGLPTGSGAGAERTTGTERSSGSERRELVVESARPLPSPPGRPGTRWLVHFVGLRSREAAEALRGAMLLGEPIADEDALWVHELVGSTVVDEQGTELGVVTGVLANPASDLLELADGSLVPLVFLRSRSAGRVVVDVPPGLIG